MSFTQTHPLKYRWLLFDADNTLFDFDTAEDYALTTTLKESGLSPDEPRKARYRAVNSALWHEFDQGNYTQDELLTERFVRFLKMEGVRGDPDEWNRRYLDHLAEHPCLMPGAETLCRNLHAVPGCTLALVTNGVAYVQRRRLTESPLAPFFGDRVYISGELGCHKPDPLFFEQALTALDAMNHREQVLVIGDGLSSDITGALRYGLDCVWYNPRHLDAGDLHPTAVISDLAQLEPFLTDS